MAYSAAAGALLAAAPDAAAQVVWVEISPPDTVHADMVGMTDPYDINFDGIGDAEFRLVQINSATLGAQDVQVSPLVNLSGDEGIGVLMSGPPSSNYGAALQFGEPVASNTAIGRAFDNANVFQFLGYNYFDTRAYGPWPGAGNRYLGVRFSLDDGVNPATTHNGWIQLEVPFSSRYIYVKGYAYNATPDGPLNAGEGELPVEIVSFRVVAEETDIILTWETASESDNAGFEVQRRDAAASPDDFEALTFVEGRGTSTESQKYSVRVREVGPGKHVFRLRQVDFDGAFAYSGEIEIQVDLPTSYALGDAYPNPFNPRANFTLAVARTQSVTLQLFDALGRHVATLHDGIVEANANHTFAIDGSGLTSGTYVYRAVGEDFVASRLVTLVK